MESNVVYLSKCSEKYYRKLHIKEANREYENKQLIVTDKMDSHKFYVAPGTTNTNIFFSTDF